jgi:hypothetical protein
MFRKINQEVNYMKQEIQTAPTSPTIEIEIQGHKVTLCFAEKADPEIAVRIKQALIGTYLQTEK